jgi:hypothetical protein
MLMKFLLIIIFAFWLTSCNDVYIRHSNLHHLKFEHYLKVKNNKLVKIITKPYQQLNKTKTTDTTLNYILCTDLKVDSIKSDCLFFLENRKVVYFDKSYWIKRGAAYDSSTYKYINRDIKF